MDLLRLGLRLRWLCDGTDRLNWRDLSVIVSESDAASAMYRHHVGADKAAWSVSEYLLASVLDGINSLIWQNGSGKGKRPDPTPRPGDSPSGTPAAVEGDQVFGDDFVPEAMSITDMDEWLGRKSS